MTARKPATRIVNHGRGHSYLLDGDKTPGVTKALDEGYPKKALVGWAADEAGKYVLNHWPELVEMEPAARYTTVRDARFIVQREASERGTEVHAQVVRSHRFPRPKAEVRATILPRIYSRINARWPTAYLWARTPASASDCRREQLEVAA